MNNKYYTPSIEEFRVGFECESNYCLINGKSSLDGGNEFIQFCFTEDNIDYMLDAYKNDAYPTEFRVKYLDEKDIESLGFKEDTYDINHFKFIQAYCNDVKINNFKCYNIINKYQNLFFDNSNNAIYNIIITTTIGEKNIPKFIGTIKNKSELKRILKMIGHGC